MEYSYNYKEALKLLELIANNYNKFIIKLISGAIKQYNCSHILDYGCSDGFFIRELNKQINNIQIEGLEPDNNSRIECSKANIKTYKELSDCEQTFDMIYMLSVLEHIQNDIAALKEVYNKLEKNGVLIIYVPAFMFLFSSIDRKSDHYRRYTLNELKSKIENAGFTIKEIKYCDSVGILASILYKLKEKFFGDNNGEFADWQVKIYDFLYPLNRILDKLFFSQLLGKNIYAIAVK